MMPHGAGVDANKTDARLLLSIFYSNPQKLEVLTVAHARWPPSHPVGLTSGL